ncbi:MAG: glutaminase [Aphanocapsa sp. GSE-SYN-MK-11-07L]|nr:glutaminase [Aphanocapsa sp. GSE-SYN-MK-11-07L]
MNKANPPESLIEIAQAPLLTWVELAQADAQNGKLPSYVPQLATVDGDRWAVQIQAVNGATWGAGATDDIFPLMSVIKPLLLLFLLETLGAEQVWQRVGQLPSDLPYNSLTQLEADQGWPRNPMLNSGAIALAELIPGSTAMERCDQLQAWLNQRSRANLQLDLGMLASVESVENPINQAIAQRLAMAGYLQSPQLATYNAICCLAGTVKDLARIGCLLAANSASIQQTVNQIMLTCGLYEQSAAFAQTVGWPTKSGVSGGVLAIVPGEAAIGLYSPKLDATGNSIVSLFLLEQLAKFHRSLDSKDYK